MVKVYCDICGKEIIRAKEVWKLSLLSKPGNVRVSYDETVEDMCESCATEIQNGLKLKFDGIPETGGGNG